MLPQLDAGVLPAPPKVAGLVNPRRTGPNDVPDTGRVIGVESDAIRPAVVSTARALTLGIGRAGASRSGLCLFDGLGNHDQRFDMRDLQRLRCRGSGVAVLFDFLEAFNHFV